MLSKESGGDPKPAEAASEATPSQDAAESKPAEVTAETPASEAPSTPAPEADSPAAEVKQVCVIFVFASSIIFGARWKQGGGRVDDHGESC